MLDTQQLKKNKKLLDNKKFYDTMALDFCAGIQYGKGPLVVWVKILCFNKKAAKELKLDNVFFGEVLL